MPPSEDCIWSREGVLNWQETEAMVYRCAHFLLQHGVQGKDLVAFDLTNSAEFMILQLATWVLGTAPALINFNLAGDALVHCLSVTKSKLVLVDADSEVRQRMEDVRSRIEGELGMKIVILDQATKNHISALAPTRIPDSYRANVSVDDPGLLLFTSGTTGMPKACPFNIGRLIVTTGSRDGGVPGLEPGPGGGRRYVPMPLCHGTGVIAGIQALVNGTTLCIGKKFSASHFWDDVRDSRATAWVYVGEAARYLLNAPPSPRDKEHNLKSMYGNGMRPDVWARFKERFGVEMVCEFFNSSEGVFGMINYCRGPFFANCVGHHGLLLRALMHNTYVPVLVDAEDGSITRHPTTGFATRTPYATGGEILVAAASEAVFAGYKDNPAATAKRFARDVFRPGDLWYRTGDALRRDSEGRWFFTDRLGDTFRWKSENVSTAEVGAAIGQFPGVVEANVYGVLVPRADGRAGCAAVFLAPERRAGFDWAAFAAFLRQRLPRYAVPVFVRVLERMAPMHNQKQNKVPLRTEGVEPEKVRAGSSPGDRLFWLPPGREAYVPFAQKDWNALVAGASKL